ncbi:MAG: SlyX family protein [Planctomycetaceae bacterium]|nr:SlyX family protein [Planctomycetaceae bacterium]
MASGDPLEERLIRIESALAHLQHDIESLNNSLSLQFRRLQGFEARFVRIEQELESFVEPPEVRDPEAERPPHY